MTKLIKDVGDNSARLKELSALADDMSEVIHALEPGPKNENPQLCVLLPAR